MKTNQETFALLSENGVERPRKSIVGKVLVVIVFVGLAVGIPIGLLIKDKSNVSSTSGQDSMGQLVGNCKTSKLNYDSSRIATGSLNTIKGKSDADPSKYDWVASYGIENLSKSKNGGFQLSLAYQNPTTDAKGVSLTSSRYILYGKFSVDLTVVNAPGAVTTFYTLSSAGDEIDFEITGNPITPTTNVFYHVADKPTDQYERNFHDSVVNGISPGTTHNYAIDWRHDYIQWLIDDKPVRTLYKNESLSVLTNKTWFPDTPSLLEFSVWDASHAPDGNTTKWAGGPISWGDKATLSAQFDNVEIQCYDDNDLPVASFP